MNNPSLDRLMMEAAAAAYNISVQNLTTHAATLTGADPNGLLYQVDTNGYVQNTLLGTYGYQVVAGFDDASALNPTGFKAAILSRTKPDGTKDWIVSFAGTELNNPLDATSDLQLGWDQWSKDNGKQILDYLRQNVESGDTLNFTGHSLGGGLAEYAAYDTITKLLPTMRETRNDPNFDLTLTLTTFNAMGVRDSIALHEGIDQSAVDTAVADLQATHYRRKGDLVSLLGGHVGDVTATLNGLTSNVYELGTDTLFLGDAHTMSTLYQADLYSARNYFPDYLDIDTTKRLVTTVIALDTEGVTDPKQLIGTVLSDLFTSVKNGDPAEVNSFMRWVVDNAKDSGRISLFTHAVLSDIDWADEIKNGVLSNPGVYTTVAQGMTAWNIVTQSLTEFNGWAGTTASDAIDAVRADVDRFINSIETYDDSISAWNVTGLRADGGSGNDALSRQAA